MEIIKGVIQYKHPIRPAKPQVVRIGVIKFEPEEAVQILISSRWLQEAKLKTRDQLPAGNRMPNGKTLHPVAVERYFIPISAVAKAEEHSKRAKAAVIAFHQAKEKAGLTADDLKAIYKAPKSAAMTEELTLQIADLERKLNKALAERDQFKGAAEASSIAFGEKSREEQSATLDACFLHALAFYQTREGAKNSQREATLNRMARVIEAIGPERIYADIILNDVVEAIKTIGDRADNTRLKKKQAIKSFFNHCCRPVVEGGLGFVNNPTANFQVGSVQAIQKVRRAKGQVKELDPRPILAAMKDPYWSAFVAVLGYAGLRLSELCALTWDNIDFEKQIIHVRPCDEYPELKTIPSYRTVKPFPNVWPHLRKLKAMKLHPKIVFKRMQGDSRYETWFNLIKGEYKATDVSKRLKKAIDDATKTGNPQCAYNLRHFWETSMRVAGKESMIELMGGHEDKTGRDFYSIHLREVEAASIPLLPESAA